MNIRKYNNYSALENIIVTDAYREHITKALKKLREIQGSTLCLNCYGVTVLWNKEKQTLFFSGSDAQEKSYYTSQYPEKTVVGKAINAFIKYIQTHPIDKEILE